MSDPLFLLAVLCANVALAEWLVRRTRLRHLGSALLVIVITAIAANAGVIPPYSDAIPVYAGVFSYVAPLGIFWLLLQVRLKGLVHVGLPLFALFLVGAAGTIAGTLCGLAVVGGQSAFGEKSFALGGMFVATYVGGSVNFNAVALQYGVVEDGALYAGATVVDSAMTTIWMAVNVALPRLARGFWPRRPGATAEGRAAEATTGLEDDTETVHPLDLALVVALGALGLWASEWLGARLGVPSMLVLTTIALVLAQVPAVARLRGPRLCGMFAVLVFLAVIGALCDVRALAGIGALGTRLMVFVTVLVAVHGLLVYGAAAALRIDAATASVASQANIGGGASALALARSLGRAELVLPAILIGSLGNALGTYLGFLVASWLR